MVKLFVDAGWFLDISPYANRSDGMTFEKCAKALPASYGAVFDRRALPWPGYSSEANLPQKQTLCSR
jgi:hypothetical protein